MHRNEYLTLLLALFVSWECSVTQADGPSAARRKLNVAIYPYVPEKAEMWLKIKTDFEDAHPGVVIHFIDLGADYYDTGLPAVLKPAPLNVSAQPKPDVIEADTVFLQDLVDQKLIDEVPSSLVPDGVYLPYSKAAVTMNGKLYGVPHWVCSNFLFFRKDDPKRHRFEAIHSLKDLEKIIACPAASDEALLTDLSGKSTLGEEYLEALLDTYVTPDEALKHLDTPEPAVVQSLNRLFSLCPGGLCDSAKHHNFGQYYARQFAQRKARAIVGYSEGMHDVVDDFLHGVREDEPAVGGIEWDDSGVAIGKDDVDAVPATWADRAFKTLCWVDALCIRNGVNGQVRQDALDFIAFFDQEAVTLGLLVPEYGHAPRYLLPARSAVYKNPNLLKAAPLYRKFELLMHDGVSVTGPQLNDKLRKLGKNIQTEGLTPVR